MTSRQTTLASYCYYLHSHDGLAPPAHSGSLIKRCGELPFFCRVEISKEAFATISQQTCAQRLPQPSVHPSPTHPLGWVPLPYLGCWGHGMCLIPSALCTAAWSPRAACRPFSVPLSGPNAIPHPVPERARGTLTIEYLPAAASWRLKTPHPRNIRVTVPSYVPSSAPQAQTLGKPVWGSN